MARLRISEKTLELNICAEVLQYIRHVPGCSQAFWIGMKQDQEARLGLDELIHNVPAGRHLALQFKAPNSEPQNQVPYRFTINDRQNRNLMRLASIRPDAAYYVFPHYNSFTKMRTDSPALLQDTWLLKVYDLRTLHTSTNRQGTHSVRTTPPSALVRSDPVTVNISKAPQALESIFNRDHGGLEGILITHTALQVWLNQLVDQAEGDKWVVGQQLRGFSTFCIT